MRKPFALGGLIILGLFFVISVFAELIIEDRSPNANEQHLNIALKSPGFKTFILKHNESLIAAQKIEKTEDAIIYTNQVGAATNISVNEWKNSDSIIERTYLLGTDRYGRSIMNRLVLGIRLSLFVGVFAVVISLLIGILMGLIGGYYGGWIDKLVMFKINVMWSIPTLLLVFAIVLAIGRGIEIIILAIGLTMWVDVARIVRGQVKKIREEQFIIAAKSYGAKDTTIMFTHILPNIIGPILVIAAANFAAAILIEAGLSYLGFGVKPPAPSIGNMLNEHYGYAITGKPILAIIPAVTIILLVLSTNLLGSGLRDVFDVKK